MNTVPNSIEFSIKKKTDFKIIVMRIGIFTAFYGTLIILLTTVFVKIFYALFIPVVIVFTYGVWFFMRFTIIEYEYSIISGDFSVTEIYNNIQRKAIITAKIKDMQSVIPFEESENYLNESVKKIYCLCSDLKSKDLYVCIFSDKKYGKCAVIFNTNKKFVQIMKFYNPQNVIVKNDFSA